MGDYNNNFFPQISKNGSPAMSFYSSFVSEIWSSSPGTPVIMFPSFKLYFYAHFYITRKVSCCFVLFFIINVFKSKKQQQQEKNRLGSVLAMVKMFTKILSSSFLAVSADTLQHLGEFSPVKPQSMRRSKVRSEGWDISLWQLSEKSAPPASLKVRHTVDDRCGLSAEIITLIY